LPDGRLHAAGRRTVRFHPFQTRFPARNIAMKFTLLACSSAALIAGAVYLVPVAFAQNSPGMPGGVLQDEFRFNQHPQMQFAASAPSQKYQNGSSSMRRKADNGDPNGCNLKCPNYNTNSN
jgi:hypothetical protein